ncbi:MAG: ATP-binding cassette domain-containing protein, partial [Bradyrhizobium sp.]|uniref:ATP-binding cassette domain-containing protein n=1 Tax=Bradyrhizobium sp. TaxID=376 RepID=UPI00391A1241
MSGALLSVENAVVDLPTPRGNLRAVDHVDLTVGAGRTLGIVGESGCGKTMLSRAVLQLLPKKAKLSGRVMFGGQDLTKLSAEKLRKLRGRSLAVVFQDPMTSLNPVLTIGTQLIETIQEHLEFDLARARQRSIELLAAVGIPAPEQRLTQYPHQLSGGMRQRVAIAVALSCEPQLLLAALPKLDVAPHTPLPAISGRPPDPTRPLKGCS